MNVEVVMSLLAVMAFLVPMAIAAWVLRFPLRARRYSVNPYGKDGRYKREVLRVIGGARTHITMARGELPFVVYDESVAAALRAAHDRGVKITLVCGPEVRVPEVGSHPILALVDEGIIDLYYPEPARPVHFVEADSRTLYWEAPHRHGALERDVVMFENSVFRAEGERKLLFADIEAGRVVRVKSAFERHVLLTEFERSQIEALVRSQGRDFENLSADEIKELRRELAS